MTDQEIDKWVEEHIKVPPKEELSKYTSVVYPILVPAVIKWGKNIAHKFYRIGKSEIPINLTWKDIAKIDAIILDVNNEFAVDYSKEIDRKKFYEEVLKRFKEIKYGQETTE